ncbi:MAG: hypothetical protein BGO96_13985 [Micrococcales bacterium 73-15]|nr:MAG: hypothetical protein BGO96_13985 [Micrococcales bacterium 73-15]
MLTAPERLRRSPATPLTSPTTPSPASPRLAAVSGAVPQETADAPHHPSPGRGACDSVRRLVATVLGSAQEPYLPWLATASLGQLHDAVALAAAQLDHERWAFGRLTSAGLAPTEPAASAGPTAPAEGVLAHPGDAGPAALPAAGDIDRVLRALALPLPVRAIPAVLPHPALLRRLTLTLLVEDGALGGAALGWLTASQALVAAGRFPGAAAIRAHGFGADTAAAWVDLLEQSSTLPCLALTESVLREHPDLTPMAFAGAQLAIRSAAALERHLTAAWRAGRRLVSWPGPEVSETPGVVVDHRGDPGSGVMATAG